MRIKIPTTGMVAFLLSVASALGQVSFFNEGFEDNGDGSRYTLSSRFNDLPNNNIFDVTTVVDHPNGGGTYTGFIGAGFFASEDTDDNSLATAPNLGNSANRGLDTQTIDFTGIDITGRSNLGFNALFAAGAVPPQYDIDDFIDVAVQIDGGGFAPILRFESTDAVVGSLPLAEDTNNSGVGDGTQLGLAFGRFSAAIAGSGVRLDLRIRIEGDSGFESIALDDVNLTSDAVDANVVSVDRVTPSPSNAGSVQWDITLDNAISGLTAANLDLIDVGSSITGESISTVTDLGAGTVWRVTANTGTGDGTLRLDVLNDTSLTPGLVNEPFTVGQTIQVDKSGPGIAISGPSASDTTSGPVTYTVTYAGATTVTLADGDITLNATGSAAGTVTVSGTGNTERTVTISGITGDGILGITIAANTATDGANNAATAGPSATFTVDNTAPTVSIGSPSVAATDSGPVSYVVTYAGADTVTLANGNVTLNATGSASGTLNVSGSGTASRTVTISGITGNGTLGISLAGGTAADTIGNLAAAAGPSGLFHVANVETGTVAILCEDFEDDGNGSRYTLSQQFNDLSNNNLFDQTTDLTHANAGTYSGQNNLGIFAAEDTDDALGDGADLQTITFNVDITSQTNLQFIGLFAAGGGNAYDTVDFIRVTAQIDGGSTETLLGFESTSSTVDSMPLALDTNNDGLGDGAQLGLAFLPFSAPITGTGTDLTLVIFIRADSGLESVALDYLKVTAESMGAPEIAVHDGPTTGDPEIVDGGAATDFGSASVVAGMIDRVYTLSNTNGLSTLTISNVTFVGGNAGDFSLVGGFPASIPGGASANITVRLDPSALGARTTTLQIDSSDADENPYDITLTGTGDATAPEIDVHDGAGTGDPSIASGGSAADFGIAIVEGEVIERTFNIDNTVGDAPLSITDISVTAGDSGDFSVAPGFPTTVPAGASDTFIVRFNPSVPGSRAATVTLSNNDADEGSYDLLVSGSGVSGNNLFCEEFEDDGAGSRYTLSVQFNDLGNNNIFDQTFDATHAEAGTYTGVSLSGFFASEDTDDALGDGSNIQSITFINSITGETGLVFSGLFAAGGGSSYDINDFIRVEVQIDGGPSQNLLEFQSTSSSMDSMPFARDTNFDGVGDGQQLGLAFQEFSAPIVGTGNQLTTTIHILADSGLESLALDRIKVSSMPPIPALQLTKLADLAPEGTTNFVPVGASVTYTYEVVNTGEVDFDEVTVSDDILGLIETFGPLIVGETNTVTTNAMISASVTNIGSAVGAIFGEEQENGPPTEDVFVTNLNDAVTIVLPVVDIVLFKSESIDPVVAGSGSGNLVYIITATNAGPFDATNVEIFEDLTLPPGVTVDSVLPSAGSFAVTTAPDGTWIIPSLPVGSNETLTVSLTVDPGASIFDTISDAATVMSADQLVINPGDDAVSETTSIRGEVDLRITKTESADPVFAGSGLSNLVYLITVTNGGPSDATGIIIAEDMTLPAGVTLESVVASAGTYTTTLAPDGIWDLPSLPMGTSETLTVTLTASSSTAPGTDVIGNVVSLSALDQSRIPATQQITLLPDRDNILYQNDPDDNAGALDFFLMQNNSSRALFHFDIASRIPPGATVLSAEAGFPIINGSTVMDANLHRLTEDWGEGIGTTGTTAGLGESSWNSSMVPTLWSTPGGVFDPTSTATRLAQPPAGTLLFPSSPALITEIENWANTPSSNLGWALLYSSASPAFHRLHSREAVGNEPYLNVDFFALGTVTVTQRTSVIVRQVDLVVTQTESVDPVFIGSGDSNLIYIVTVTNAGPDDVEGAVINEDLTLPAGTTVASITPSAGAFAATTAPDGDWTVDLAVGAVETLTIALTVGNSTAPGFGEISSTAAVTGTGRGETLINTGDDSASDSTDVLGQPSCIVNAPAGGLQGGVITIDFDSIAPNSVTPGFAGLLIDVEYSLDGGTNFFLATDGGTGSVQGNPAIQFGPGNDTWDWHSFTDIPGSETGVIVRLRVTDITYNLTSECTTVIDVNNRPSCVITTATGPVPTSNTSIQFTTASPSGNLLDLLLEYTLDGIDYFPLSDVGMGGISNPDADVPAGPNNFSWAAPSDVTGVEPGVLVRLTTTDAVTGSSSICELLFGLALDIAQADVAIEKTAPLFAEPHMPFDYVLTVTNAGPEATTNVVVTDTLPAELLFDSLASSPGLLELGGGAIEWDVGVLEVGASTSVTLSVSFTNCCVQGPFTNLVSVSHREFDPVSANNATSHVITAIADAVVPTLVLPADLTVECDGDTTTNNTGLATATDNCSPTVAITFADSIIIPPGGTGVIDRVWSAMDVCGNTAMATQEITVVDTTAPTIVCAPDILVSNDFGECGAALSRQPPPTANDNCTLASVTNDFNGLPFLDDFYPVGTTLVTWTAVDAAGNTASCTQLVTVIDAEAPLLTCPVDINTTNDVGVCGANLIIPPTEIGDNCMGSATVTNNVTGTADASGQYPIGTTEVVWTATDAAGNVSVCTQMVTVSDAEAPTIVCPVEVNATNDLGVCEAVLVIDAPLANDNCPGVTFTNDFNNTSDASGTYLVGTTLVTWTATDAAGITASCVQTVVVSDVEAPLLVCPTDILTTNGIEACEAVVENPAPVFSDNCPGAVVSNSFTHTDDASGFYPVGITEVVWTVVDAAGNSAICTQLVTVIDVEAPTLVCPAPVSVDNDPGTCGAAIAIPVPFVLDNCPGVVFSNRVFGTTDASGTYPVGSTEVVWVATDLTGNSTLCTQLVTVADAENPVITCPPDLTIECDASTNVVDTGIATATDNCDTNLIITSSDVILPGRCPQERTIQRAWTAMDAAGNSAACVQTITLVDTTGPVLTLPPDLNDCYLSTNVADSGTATAIDNCGAATVTFSDVAFTSIGTQMVTRTWTAVDACGNATSATQTITSISFVDLAIGISSAPDPVIIGDPLTLTVSMTNNGPCDASGVVLDVMLSPDVTFQSASSSNCTLVGQQLTCPIGDLAAGGVTSVIVNTSVNFENITSLTNAVQILGDQFEPVLANNTNAAPTAIVPRFDLVLIDDVNGYGFIRGATNGSYLVDSMFDLFPEAINGKYAFDRWTVNGVDAGTANPLSIQLVGATTVEVSFASTFLDVTSETASSLGNWRLDFNTGIMYADLTLCNTATTDVRLIEPFWYAFPRDPRQFLVSPDGQTNGLDYVDITAAVNAALPGIGNGDNALDPGECVVISRIGFYRIDAVPFDGSTIATIFADPPGDGGANSYDGDTDRDGIINGWESDFGLNPNHASDALSDPDNDGASNWHEFQADTDPGVQSSLLRVTHVVPQGDQLIVHWTGGEAVTQYIEWAPSVTGPWTRLQTVLPPTTIEGEQAFSATLPANGIFRVTVEEK